MSLSGDPRTVQLNEDIKKLEARIAELKAERDGTSAASSADGMRMILMGPPGAGTLDGMSIVNISS